VGGGVTQIEVLRAVKQVRAAAKNEPQVLIETDLAMRFAALACSWPGNYFSPTHQCFDPSYCDLMIHKAELMIAKLMARALT